VVLILVAGVLYVKFWKKEAEKVDVSEFGNEFHDNGFDDDDDY